MDKLWAMEVFVRIMECGSFSKAADSLGLANATVTASVRNLEQHLGVTLIQRNTRHLRLTDEGEIFFPRCKEILASVVQVEREITGQAQEVSGLLKLESPFALGQDLLCPLLPALARRYPKLSIALNLTNHPRNLIEHGTDVAIRMDSVEDADLVARPFYKAKYIVCGAPELVATFDGIHPKNLDQKMCLGLFKDSYQNVNRWQLRRGDEDITLRPEGVVSFNNTTSLLEAARQGVGLIYILDIFAEQDIKNGMLKPLFEDWETAVRVFHAVTVKSRFGCIKSRAFIEFLLEIFDDERRPSVLEPIEIESKRFKRR